MNLKEKLEYHYKAFNFEKIEPIQWEEIAAQSNLFPKSISHLLVKTDLTSPTNRKQACKIFVSALDKYNQSDIDKTIELLKES